MSTLTNEPEQLIDDDSKVLAELEGLFQKESAKVFGNAFLDSALITTLLDFAFEFLGNCLGGLSPSGIKDRAGRLTRRDNRILRISIKREFPETRGLRGWNRLQQYKQVILNTATNASDELLSQAIRMAA